jgi:hypothetical protein
MMAEGMAVRMRFCEIDCSFSGFLCFCKESLGKKAASRTPFAKGVLENLPKGEGHSRF